MKGILNKITKENIQALLAAGVNYSVEYTADFFRTLFQVLDFRKILPEVRGRKTDRMLLLAVMLLVITGVIMVWSASMYEEGSSMAARQLKFAFWGFVCMMWLSGVDYRKMRKLGGGGVIVCIGFLVAILLGAGGEYYGASRGISIGSFSFMPVELTKIAVILFVSNFFVKHYDDADKYSIYFLVVLFCGFIGILVLKQPAMSSALIILATILMIYLYAGCKIPVFIFTVIAGGIGAALYAVHSWRIERIYAVFDPFAPELFHGAGWQPAQSLMALGSGGLIGKGIGNGLSKLSYLPELQNDYVFSVIGEEMGLIGCLLIIAGFIFVILRMFIVAFRSKDLFGKFVASGMATLIAIQVIFNLMVVTNSFPSTGVSLPFISYGGSSLFTLMAGVGIVLNIARNTQNQ